jgi:hypothetical protein
MLILATGGLFGFGCSLAESSAETAESLFSCENTQFSYATVDLPPEHGNCKALG